MGKDRIRLVDFGCLETGERVTLALLSFGDLRASFLDYGATLVSLKLPPRAGAGEDVVLGFSTLDGYTRRHPYFGSTVGRVAGRIGSARFTLEGREHRLVANDGPSHIHGGLRGFDRQLWKLEAYEEGGEPRLRYERRSPSGEEGYPGNLDLVLTYGLGSDNEVLLRHEARSDAPTPLNLTNHAYFNLRGEGQGGIHDHEISIDADRYLETGPGLVPTGIILPVEGGPYDLRKATSLRPRLEVLGGFDSYYVLNERGEGLRDCARLREPQSGRGLHLRSTLPGFQFYTGNFLAGELGKQGSRYDRHAGFCLETQYYPDSPNHENFPSIILSPGQTRREETRFGFTV